MPLRHTIQHHARRLTRRFPFLQRISISLGLLTLVWIYLIYWGEKRVYDNHIAACDWKKWERWPSEAAPHRLVFVADPQLVDPHTYPGRPWPLSSLTEAYTDLYMTRNFRLISGKLDPDSVVFLGDLFDGGREWGTDWKERGRRGLLKRSDQDTKEAIHSASTQKSEAAQEEAVNKREDAVDSRGNDLTVFVPGENGRWSIWGQEQWMSEYRRFSHIFFDQNQLYPKSRRELHVHAHEGTSSGGIENGAEDKLQQHYAITGTKHRRLYTSLPGNHDLGLGSGVQMPVRKRFRMHFGEPNAVRVIGNHTFVSLDTPSLTAASEYTKEGVESSAEQMKLQEHIWREPMDFLANIRKPVQKAVQDAFAEHYPVAARKGLYSHEAVLAEDAIAPEHSKIGNEDASLPMVLLSHIPLHRDIDTDCGKNREHGKAIPIMAGYQYQNVVTRTLSDIIAKRLSQAGELVHVFSGDDHDYCDVVHRYNVGGITPTSVREITVKSFSWAMGVRRPGFQLVSLWNPVDANGETVGTPLPTIQTQMCLLPDQLGIFIDYALMFAFTLAVLLIRAIWVAFRKSPDEDAEQDAATPLAASMLQIQLPVSGSGNGFSLAKGTRATKKGRQRGSSTSTSKQNDNGYLGVQRSMGARTRSISPTPGDGFTQNLYGGSGPLIEKAGYYPQLRWQDPADETDEESNIGDPIDSQEKWKPLKKRKGSIHRIWEEFVVSMVFVGIPSGLYYFSWLWRG